MRLLMVLYLVAVVFWVLLPPILGLGFWPYILGLLTLIAAGFLLDSLRQRHLLVSRMSTAVWALTARKSTKGWRLVGTRYHWALRSRSSAMIVSGPIRAMTEGSARPTGSMSSSGGLPMGGPGATASPGQPK